MTCMGLPERAISIRAPWWWFILHSGKRVENRDWSYLPNYRGPVLIHASKWFNGQAILDTFAGMETERRAGVVMWYREQSMALASLKAQSGGIVGVADIVDARWNGPEPTDPWAVPGAVGLILDNVRPLPFVPCKGALGFFRVPDDVRAALALGDAQSTSRPCCSGAQRQTSMF